MKKLFMIALLFVGIVSFAQEENRRPNREARERANSEQRNADELKRLTKELDLTVDQQELVKQFIADRNAQRENFRGQGNFNAGPPSEADREKFMQRMRENRAAQEAKMKGILNADQFQKWSKSQSSFPGGGMGGMRPQRPDNDQS